MSTNEVAQRAGTGVWLGAPQGLEAWRTRVQTPFRPGDPTPRDWFVRLEALSKPREDGPSRAAVTVAALATSMGTSRDTLDEGYVFSGYPVLTDALGFASEPAAETAPLTRLYRQARMASFLQYRDGFVAALAALPFTAEAAAHGYTRVVLEWARRWPGLTVADRHERARAEAAHEPALRRGRHRDRFLRTTRTALPLIVEHDLRDLLRMAQVEASETDSARARRIGGEIAMLAVLDQLAFAASHVVEDPTLTSLTATNMVRLQTNDALGGALLRMRVRPRDALLIESRVIEEVRRLLIEPRVDVVTAGKASVILADLEAQFAVLSVVRRVFEAEAGDD